MTKLMAITSFILLLTQMGEGAMGGNITNISEECRSNLLSIKGAVEKIKRNNFYKNGNLNFIDTQKQIQNLLPKHISEECVDFIGEIFTEKETRKIKNGYVFYVAAASFDVQFNINISGEVVDVIAYGK
ncbi:hypothetical protein [Pleomorphomonas carboxyditropha]|uniref:hypothetical protein n=1 Tax=Pleomorphomonas carboxyditropha TaxID=2023338 RepID=UPI00105442EF|nr:hypothetical protein [Pleomorphomonas carboxyditropha]